MNKIVEKLNRLTDSQQMAAFIIGVLAVSLLCSLVEMWFMP